MENSDQMNPSHKLIRLKIYHKTDQTQKFNFFIYNIIIFPLKEAAKRGKNGVMKENGTANYLWELMERVVEAEPLCADIRSECVAAADASHLKERSANLHDTMVLYQ